MAIIIHPAGAPFELDCNQDEAGILSLVSLIAVFLALIVCTGFYAFVYNQKDSVGRPVDSDESVAYQGSDCNPYAVPIGRRPWFQPFCFLNQSINTPSDWLGDWSSLSSSENEIETTTYGKDNNNTNSNTFFLAEQQYNTCIFQRSSIKL